MNNKLPLTKGIQMFNIVRKYKIKVNNKVLIHFDIILRVFLSYLIMAHRLAHLNKKHNTYQQQAETYQTQQANHEPSYVPSNIKTKNPQNMSDKMPRPIFPSTNQIQIYEKLGFRKNLPSFPPPQSLFEAQNNYDASPQFIRPTSIVIHSTPKKSIFPLGAWITPFGGQNVPCINVQSPLRCHRCKAYVNPYFQFDGSRKLATCNICGMKFQVQETIDRKNLEATQISTRGVIDFVVRDKFYHMKRTDIIKIIICIEVSQVTIELGIFNTIIESIKSTIDNNSFEDKVRIGVMYFGEQGIVFPKLRKCENWQQTQMSQYVVKVTENSAFCCPLSDSQFLLDPNNEKDKLIYLVDQISAKAMNYYQKGRFTNSANYVAALKCLKQSFENETGRIMLFTCLDPRSGKCSIRPRNEEESKLPLKPLHNQFYELSKQLLKARIGVEHFIFTKDNMISHELATVHFLSSQTSGLLHFYPGYNHENNSQHLYYSIYRSLSKPFAYDINYTCRVSNGMNIMSFCTTSGVKETRDVTMGCMDSGHSLAVLFEHQEKIEESYGGFIQFAMMYTTGSGQRHIRVINFRYIISPKLDNVYESIDYLAVANILARQYTSKLFTSDPPKIRQQLVNKLATIIAEYKFKCNPSMQAAKYSDLGAPNNLKFALAYLHVIANSKLFINPLKLTSDYRIAEILKINSLDFFSFAMKYYPKLYPLTMDIYQNEPLPGDFINPVEEEDVNGQQQQQIAVLPENLPLTKSSIKDYGVYLHNDGEYLTMFVMPNADEELMNQLFGTTDWQQIENQGLTELQGSHNIRVNIIISELRRRNSANNGIYLPLLIKTPIKKGPFGELVNNIAKQDYHQMNYYSFLDQVHRLAQQFAK